MTFSPPFARPLCRRGVAALLAQCLPVTAPSLLLAMGVAQECLPLDAQVACLGAMNRADRNETFEVNITKKIHV